jgi:hypothetical protein
MSFGWIGLYENFYNFYMFSKVPSCPLSRKLVCYAGWLVDHCDSQGHSLFPLPQHVLLPVGCVSMMTTRLFQQSTICSGNPRGLVSMMTTQSPCSASHQLALLIRVAGEHGDYAGILFRQCPFYYVNPSGLLSLTT